jgi:hypothetical protein
MNEPLITGESTQGVGVITLQYGPEQMMTPGAEIGSKLVAKYAELRETTHNPSVVVDIKADTAGSPVIRALYDLYRNVRSNRGQLLCVGYPHDYLPSLYSLGLPDRPGFTMEIGLEDAIKRIITRPM